MHRRQEGLSALHMAAHYGHASIVARLVARGARVDSVDGYGDTPLHNAASQGYADVITALLRGGANADAQNMVRAGPWRANLAFWLKLCA